MKVLTGLVSLAALAALGGCSVSIGNASIDPNDLSEVVATRLQEITPDSATPVIDCGTDTITAKKDNVVHCDLTDPETQDHYDVEVTITSVEGDKYEVNIRVGQEPK